MAASAMARVAGRGPSLEEQPPIDAVIAVIIRYRLQGAVRGADGGADVVADVVALRGECAIAAGKQKRQELNQRTDHACVEIGGAHRTCWS